MNLVALTLNKTMVDRIVVWYEEALAALPPQDSIMRLYLWREAFPFVMAKYAMEE